MSNEMSAITSDIIRIVCHPYLVIRFLMFEWPYGWWTAIFCSIIICIMNEVGKKRNEHSKK